MKRGIVPVAVALLSAAAVIAACSAAERAPRAVRPALAPMPVIRSLPDPAIGIAAPSLAAFDASCRCVPSLKVTYVRWGESARDAGLAADLARGAVPLAELEPYGTTLADVAAGTSDQWLESFARDVAALRSMVLVSFAAEANNDSYPWGFRAAPHVEEVAAWRHVVSVFRQAGASNARFAWVINAEGRHTSSLAPLWPGAGYADYVGIDGYATHPWTTFAGLFGRTIADVRKLASVPVMITETAASPAAGQARWVGALNAGLGQYRLAGWSWFNVDQLGGSDPDAPLGNREDWALTGAALTAYANAARQHRPR